MHTKPLQVLRVLAAIAGLTLCFPAAARADEPNRVARVSVSEDEAGSTIVVIETDRAVARPNAFFLEAPGRFVLDLPGASWDRSGGQGEGAGLAGRYRYANRPEGAARLVLDLNSPARVAAQRTENRGRRLVFTLAAAGVTPLAQPAVSRGGPAPPAPNSHRRLIVIDPGHGGRDPGAVNHDGVREKEVVLAAALLLRDQLLARGYDVAMTRGDDRFIELEDRVAFARERHADLFISLHADSAPGSRASGAAVYMLSETGADRSRTIMGSQDWNLDLGDAPRAGDVHSILVSLTQRETTNRSAAFAQGVLDQLAAAEVPVWRDTPRNAGFFVLLAPDVPAVLVEMGFLTTAADAARLSDPAAQRRLTSALADAVDTYFAEPRQVAAR